jgi:hypothetical protein
MGFADWLKKIFSPPAVVPPDERQLASAVESALASSLITLPAGEHGWIPLVDAARLFSTAEQQYAFGELDDAGKNRLALFAAEHQCSLDFRPTEGRLYFHKDG